MRTLYAVDEDDRVVWVTYVNLFKLDLRSGSSRSVYWRLGGKPSANGVQ